MDAYDELNAWALGTAGAPCHQFVVDAHAAQSADDDTKPITLAFALVGLCLHLEHRLDGDAIRRAHQQMASRRRRWPRFTLPADRGRWSAADVLAFPDAGRAAAVDTWCASVWSSFAGCHDEVRALLRTSLPGT